jgi:hypothetical protein
MGQKNKISTCSKEKNNWKNIKEELKKKRKSKT